jgi:hypothetical protein
VDAVLSSLGQAVPAIDEIGPDDSFVLEWDGERHEFVQKWGEVVRAASKKPEMTSQFVKGDIVKQRATLHEYIKETYANIEGAWEGGFIELVPPIDGPVDSGGLEYSCVPDVPPGLHVLGRDVGGLSTPRFWFSVCETVWQSDTHVGVLHSTENVAKYIGGYVLDVLEPNRSETENWEELVKFAGRFSEGSAFFALIDGQTLEKTRWDLRQELRRDNIGYIFIEDYEDIPLDADEADIDPLSLQELDCIGREHDIPIYV